MINNPSQDIRLAHQQALEIPKSYDETDPMEQLRRQLWTKVFQAAQQEAERINDLTQGTVFQRDLDAQDVVNQWYLDIESDSQITHDYRAHDRTTGFKTISQELKEEEIRYNREAELLWEMEFRKWWENGKKGPKPRKPKPVHFHTVQYEQFEDFGSGAWSEIQEEVESLEALRERRADIRQDLADDPENPYEDDRGNRRLTVRHTHKGTRLSYRGTKGCLSGVYTDTLPEPTYRTPKQRATLMKTLLQSDNVIDVLMAKGMNRKFKFPADRKAASNARKLSRS
jgi:hypothetical protein